MEGGSAPRNLLQAWLNRRGHSFSEVEVEVEQTAQAEPGGQPSFRARASVLGLSASAEASRRKVATAKAYGGVHALLEAAEEEGSLRLAVVPDKLNAADLRRQWERAERHQPPAPAQQPWYAWGAPAQQQGGGAPTWGGAGSGVAGQGGARGQQWPGSAPPPPSQSWEASAQGWGAHSSGHWQPAAHAPAQVRPALPRVYERSAQGQGRGEGEGQHDGVKRGWPASQSHQQVRQRTRETFIAAPRGDASPAVADEAEEELEPTVLGSGADTITITSKKHNGRDRLHDFYVAKGLQLEENGQYSRRGEGAAEPREGCDGSAERPQEPSEACDMDGGDGQESAAAASDQMGQGQPSKPARSHLPSGVPRSDAVRVDMQTEGRLAEGIDRDTSHIDLETLLGESIAGLGLDAAVPAEDAAARVSFATTGEKISGPRHYQHELMQRAKQENIIAFLETGSGKTFIAVMLMKELVMPRVLAYTTLMAAERKARGASGVVDDVPRLKKELADRMGGGLLLPRTQHLEAYGSSQAGLVLPLERQVAQVVRSMATAVSKAVQSGRAVAETYHWSSSGGGCMCDPRWKPPRPDEVMRIVRSVPARAPILENEQQRTEPALEHKMVAFLVPRVPLVFQQAEVIRINTELSVGEYCGEHGGDRLNYQAWQYEFQHRDCIVCTPQILLNILRHGFVQLTAFKLLVFDECHHAQKQHAYNLIMQEFYWPLTRATRPRVFGMTASPVIKTGADSDSSREKHRAAIIQLESNLGARVVTLGKDSQAELDKHAPRPQEAELEHEPAPLGTFPYATFPATAKRLIKVLLRLNPLLGIEAEKKPRRLTKAARYEGEQEEQDQEQAREQGEEEGEGEAEAAAMDAAKLQQPEHRALQQKQTAKQQRQHAAQREVWQRKTEVSAVNVLEELGPWAAHGFLDRLTLSQRAARAGADRSLDLLHGAAATDINDSTKLSDRAAPKDNELTPKVRALFEILDIQSRRPGFGGIVFVERRQTAIWLAEVIRRSKRLAECGIETAAVVGHGARHHLHDPCSDSMDLREQNSILAAFRDGKVNLLVATSLVEEGLDVLPCSLVVRFNAIDTLVSYVQSRGRARHPNSLYVMMIERDKKQKGRGMRSQAAAHEEQVVRAVANEDRPLLRVKDGPEISEEWLGEDRAYRVESTGALATLSSAMHMVRHYCHNLPKDNYCTMSPVFIFQNDVAGTICTLELPINAAVRRVVSAPCAEGEDAAKRSVCLEACRQLHQCKALTDHLLPHKELKAGVPEREMNPDPAGLGKGRRAHSYTVRGPRVLCGCPQMAPGGSVRLFVYKIFVAHEFEDLDRAFCFATHDAIPYLDAMELYDKSVQANFDAGLRPLGCLQLGVQALECCREFTAALFGCLTKVSHREITYAHGPDHTSYLILPLNPGWDAARGVDDAALPEAQWAGACQQEIAPAGADAWAFFDREAMARVTSMADPSTWEPVDLANLAAVPGRVVVTRYNGQKYLCRGLTDLTPESPFPAGARREQDLVLNEPIHTYLPPTVKTVKAGTPAADEGSAPQPPPAAPPAAPPAEPPAEEARPAYSTYAEYYANAWKETVRPDQRLIRAEFTGVRHMMPHLKRKVKESDVVLLVPELCLCFPLPYTAFFLPSLCIRVERQLLLMELKQQIGIPVDAALFQEAMTTAMADPICNYERLENLGDALLKYCVSVHLFLEHPRHHEGQLSVMRMKMVSNKNLCAKAVERRLFHYLLAGPPLPKAWAPPGASQRSRMIGDKTLADVVESLIGAFYKTRDSVEDVLQFMAWAGIMSCDHGRVLHPERWWAAEGEPRRRHVEQALALAEPLGNFESLRLGYVFTHKPLLLEAFTHASFQRAATPCYQRLEYLGDAVLDFYVTTDLYDRYPDIGPGCITDCRYAGVNNETLAAISVSHGYHHCLFHHSADLLREMTTFVRWVAQGGHVAAASAYEDRAADAPKILGDLFESVAGAVFLDGGVEAAGVAIRRLMKPYLERYATPDTVVLDPRRALQKLCQQKGIFDHMEYRIVVGEKGGLGMGVFYKGEQISFGEGGAFIRAKRVAARRAVEYLQERDAAAKTEKDADAKTEKEEQEKEKGQSDVIGAERSGAPCEES